MSLHVRHNAHTKPHARIIIGCCVVVLCAAALYQTDSLLMPGGQEAKAAAVEICLPKSTPQREETYRVEVPDCDLPPPPPLCLIDTTPVLEALPVEELQTKADLEPTPDTVQMAFALQDIEEEAPPKAAAPPPAKRVTTANVYTPPQYAATPQPPYPRELQRRRLSGSVRVRIQVNAQGKPTAVEVLSTPHPGFGKAAVQTILSSWKFIPARSNQQAVAATVTTTIHFVN